MFTRCDGLIVLPKKGRNVKTIILDLNIEPEYIRAINNEFGPVSDYVCTHTHLDHSAHVYVWEELGVKIHAPGPMYKTLYDRVNFLDYFGFLDGVSLETGKSFTYKMGYKECKDVNPFTPGEILIFEGLNVETIHFPGHSIGHIGFFIEDGKIIHISCLGFDLQEPSSEGFGPWYGFEQCSIDQYFKDIDKAESIFLERAELLTSSHSYIVKPPDKTPFNYMRKKIESNQTIVDQAIMSLKPSKENVRMEEYLALDLFFPKNKMKDFMKDIYALWESWIISKHIERSKFLI